MSIVIIILQVLSGLLFLVIGSMTIVGRKFSSKLSGTLAILNGFG